MNNTENKNNSNNNDDLGCLGFIIIILIVVALFNCDNFPEWNFLGLDLDFEKKEYTPIVYENNLYLINQKNGKTYILKRDVLGKNSYYSYQLLTKPKQKSKINSDDPLGLSF